eukprot:12529849-Alexandrium_andersonii.AAC.1
MRWTTGPSRAPWLSASLQVCSAKRLLAGALCAELLRAAAGARDAHAGHAAEQPASSLEEQGASQPGAASAACVPASGASAAQR